MLLVKFPHGFLKSMVGTFLLCLALGVRNSLVGLHDSSLSLLEGVLGMSNFLGLLGDGLFSLFAVMLLGMLFGSFLGTIIIKQISSCMFNTSKEEGIGYLQRDFSHRVVTSSVVGGVSDNNSSEESESSDFGNEHYL